MGSRELRLERLSADEVVPLRTRILRPLQSEPCIYEVDDAHATLHYGLVDEDGEPRAVMTLFPAACPEFPQESALRLRGLCVEEGLRGRGLGRRLLEGGIARAAVAALSVKIVWCNARTSAAAFYEACGFEPVGEVFDVPGVGPHVVMWRPMPLILA